MKKFTFLIVLFLNATVILAQSASPSEVRYSKNDSINLILLRKAENKNLVFDKEDLKVIQRANAILSDASKWHQQDDRVCKDDNENGKYSLYCALYQAFLDTNSAFDHRKASMQLIRFVIDSYNQNRVTEHRLRDWNNHPDTTFEEVKKLLTQSEEIIKMKL